jgi:hypothetical protein
MVELSIDGMNVAVKDESLLVQLLSLSGQCTLANGNGREQLNEKELQSDVALQF